MLCGNAGCAMYETCTRNGVEHQPLLDHRGWKGETGRVVFRVGLPQIHAKLASCLSSLLHEVFESCMQPPCPAFHPFYTEVFES
jgi:hypothetical protein